MFRARQNRFAEPEMLNIRPQKSSEEFCKFGSDAVLGEFMSKGEGLAEHRLAEGAVLLTLGVEWAMVTGIGAETAPGICC